MPSREEIAKQFSDLQIRICKAIEKLDGGETFREDNWERPGGGGGRSRILEGGKLIEKGGVNFSAVFGEIPEILSLKKSTEKDSGNFYATGLSIVLHPVNPWVPIIHMNIRYFEKDDGVSWFGGGIDLTPHYILPDDAQFFHKALKEVCDQHSVSDYWDFKKQADDYFFIPHRNETRGIGGIFFDHLIPNSVQEKKSLFDFVLDLGNSFAVIYSELALRNCKRSFGEEEKRWQKIRRGRYVEFNLVYDRGTKFGLETNGRTESILMSLPPIAEWKYDLKPEQTSRENETLNYLKKGINWLERF